MQRYDINSCSEDCDPVTLMKDGDYVLYADQLEIAKEKDVENKTLMVEKTTLHEKIAALTVHAQKEITGSMLLNHI